jgi:hypothetical protein
MEPVYLGDGAYAYCAGEEIYIYTHNGVGVTNKVVLDPVSWKVLKDLVETKLGI